MKINTFKTNHDKKIKTYKMTEKYLLLITLLYIIVHKIELFYFLKYWFNEKR